jgi:hypothetical protein
MAGWRCRAGAASALRYAAYQKAEWRRIFPIAGIPA